MSINWLSKFRSNKATALHMEDTVKSLTTEIKLLHDDQQAASMRYDVKIRELRALEEELARVKLEKKMGEEDIKHMVKMKEEALEIEKQKFELKVQGEKQTAIAAVKDDYQKKVEVLLGEQLKNIQSMYSEVLKRLPNVEVMFGNKESAGEKED